MKKVFIVIVFSLLQTYSYGQVTAQFVLNPSVGCAIPHTVFFTDQSIMPDTWLWDFDDGNTSTLQNPIHSYTSTGVFIVRLTVTDTILGISDVITDTVRVSNPTADFGGTGSNFFPGPPDSFFGCGPLTVNFTDSSVASFGIASWNWDFGDGGTDTVQNPSYIYQTPGIYTVLLMITDSNGCISTRTRVSYVQVIGPDVNFGADTTTGCPNTTINFTDSTIFGAPITNWTWDFGDGNNSILQNPMNTYTTLDSFDVSLTVTDIDGCSRTFTRTDFIQIMDTVAPTIVCPNDTSVIADVSCNGVLAGYTALAITTDNCDLSPVITQFPLSGAIINSDTTVWLFSTDASGNVDSCSFMVTLIDTIVPSITCPNDTSVIADASCNGVLTDYTALAITTDNCDSNPVVTQFPLSGATITTDTTVWLFSADASGNVDSCSFMVVIIDTLAPSIICPVAQTVIADTSCSGVLADYTTMVTTTDNCDLIPVVTQSPLSGDTINSDTIVWLFSTDASGNVDSCSFMVTLIDTIVPSITCPNDTNVIADGSCNGDISRLHYFGNYC